MDLQPEMSNLRRRNMRPTSGSCSDIILPNTSTAPAGPSYKCLMRLRYCSSEPREIPRNSTSRRNVFLGDRRSFCAGENSRVIALLGREERGWEENIGENPIRLSRAASAKWSLEQVANQHYIRSEVICTIHGTSLRVEAISQSFAAKPATTFLLSLLLQDGLWPGCRKLSIFKPPTNPATSCIKSSRHWPKGSSLVCRPKPAMSRRRIR